MASTGFSGSDVQVQLRYRLFGEGLAVSSISRRLEVGCLGMSCAKPCACNLQGHGRLTPVDFPGFVMRGRTTSDGAHFGGDGGDGGSRKPVPPSGPRR